MESNPANFEQYHIRRLYDEETGTWFFSVVDVVQALIQQRMTGQESAFGTGKENWKKIVSKDNFLPNTKKLPVKE
jgi:hypothetical protein